MYLSQEINLNDLNKLIVLRSYLHSHGLVKEAGAIDDLIDGVRDRATVIWDENKALAAKILFIAALGMAAKGYYDYSDNIDSPKDAERIFDELEEEDYISYVVKSGDSLWEISREHYPEINPEVGIQLIMDENNIRNGNEIFPGQELKLPRKEAIVSAANGDSDEALGLDASGDGESAATGDSRSRLNRILSSEVLPNLKQWEGAAANKGAVPRGGRIHSTGYRGGTDHTVGFGHKLTPAEKRRAGLARGGRDRSGEIMWADIHGVEVTYDPSWSGLTPEEADQILLGDAERFVEMVNRKDLELTQYEFDALVHFAFNVGHVPNSIVKLIRNNKYEDVPNKMREYHLSAGRHSDGLANRREDEVKIWNGDYPN